MSVGNLLKSTTTVAAAQDAATISGLPSVGSVGIQVTGTFSATITFEATVDGTNYVALNCLPSNSATTASTATERVPLRSPLAGMRRFGHGVRPTPLARPS